MERALTSIVVECHLSGLICAHAGPTAESIVTLRSPVISQTITFLNGDHEDFAPAAAILFVTIVGRAAR